jgi:hypothetical protein
MKKDRMIIRKKFGDFNVTFIKDIKVISIRYKNRDIWVRMSDYDVGYKVNDEQKCLIYDYEKQPQMP